MPDAQADHAGTVGLGGWIIINLRFTGDGGLTGGEQELAARVYSLNQASDNYGSRWVQKIPN